MGNVKISAFSSQPDLSLIDGLAGYEGTVGNYTNARISGSQLQTWLQNNLTFVTGSGTVNTLPVFTSSTGVLGDSLISQTISSANTVQIGDANPGSSGKLNVKTADRQSGIVSGVLRTIPSGFTNFYGIIGTARSSNGSTNWTNTGVAGYGSASQTRNSGVYGEGGSVSTSNLGTNYGGHFLAQNGDNNYSLRLEDGTESAGKFLKCITADGEANWSVVPQGVASLSIGTVAISTGNSLTVNTVSEVATLTPHYYAGGTNVGYVPTGGTAQKLLAGDGSWQSPTFTAKQFPFSGVDTDPILSVNVGTSGGVPVTTGQIRLVGGNNVTVTKTTDNSVTIDGSGGGSVSSVGLTMPAAFAVADSPVTGSGTLAVTTTGGGANEYLKSNGTWDTPAGTYVLPLASSSVRGGIKIGFPESGKNYPVELQLEQAFVNVPWTDNNDNTTYTINATQTGGTNLNPNLTLTGSNPSSTDDVQFLGDIVTVTKNVNDSITWSIPSFSGGTNIGAVPTASAAPTGSFLKNDGTWAVPTNTGLTSVGLVMSSIPGFSVSGSPLTANGDITVAPAGGTNGQYLDYQGNWNTPANTTYTQGQGISIVGTTISVATTGTTTVGDLKIDGKIENGTGVDLDLDSTEDIKLDAAKDIEITATGSTTGIKLDSDKMVTVEAKEAISLDVKATATGATPINAQPRLGGAMVVHGDTTGGGAYDGSITLNCSADTHGVTIKSPPHSAAATYTLVLPVDEGENGKVLQTDGSGNTSWVAQANTTYAISSVTDGSNVDILLTAGTGGTNSTVQLTAGTGISLSQTGGNNVEIAASGGSGGGFPSAVTASSTAATSAAVDTLYTITTTSGVADIVVTLPTAASNSAKIIGVKYAAQNSVNDTVVIKTISSQTIDGTNRTTNGLPLASVGTYFELVSDGSNWWIK